MNIIELLSDKIKQLNDLVVNNPTLTIKLITIMLCTLLLGLLLYHLLDILMQYKHDKKISSTTVLLKILPKETAKIKETEILLRNIHAVLLNTKWRKILHGRPYMSFEIVGDQEHIRFYIKVPRDYKDLLCERIYATYSEIEIKEVEEDYLPERAWVTLGERLSYLYKRFIKKEKVKKVKNHLSIHGTEMELGYHHVLKIKTKCDNDILGSVLAGMKNMEWHEKAVVQILVRPLDNKWQIRGRNTLGEFERKGVRPKRGNDWTNFFRALSEQFRDELDVAFGIKQKVLKKTRVDRKEITVASDKLFEPGFETIIRVFGVSHNKKGIRTRIKSITSAWNELDQENRFKRDKVYARRFFYKRAKDRRMYLIDRLNILTSSELANFFLRLPGKEMIDEYSQIESLRVKEFAPPKGVITDKNIFAKNTYRGKETMIGIDDKALTRHIVVQGKTGTGKSEWFKTMGLNHIKQGRGLMLLEPHGKLADEFMELIPENRRKDVIYVDLFDPYPPPFNFCKVFERPGVSYEDALEKTTEEVIEIFARNFKEAWSGKNEYYLTNAIKTVIELKDGNILDIQRLFTDKAFREYALGEIKDPQMINFWKTEFKENGKGDLSPATQSTVLSIMHKLGKFLNSKKLLRAIAQEDCIDFKEILDTNKIVIFRFSKDNMSEDRIKFVGGIALKLLMVAAFARDKKMWNDPYIVVLDEAQNFISETIKTWLYELRKYGLCLLPMHQVLEQMNDVKGLVDALYGNVGTTITFAVGKPDAPYFEGIYGPRVDEDDLKNLPASRYGYCRLLVNGETSDTFNIYSLDRPEVPMEEGKKSVFEIKKHNREGRLHYKEIDRIIKEKFEKIGEFQEEEFIQELDEEYEFLDKTESYKKQPEPPIDENLEEAAASSEETNNLQSIKKPKKLSDFLEENTISSQKNTLDVVNNIEKELKEDKIEEDQENIWLKLKELEKDQKGGK